MPNRTPSFIFGRTDDSPSLGRIAVRSRFWSRPRFLILAAATLSHGACARLTSAPISLCSAALKCSRPAATRVEVLIPILAERIDHVAARSPSFRAAWQLIQGSGVPVRIGTDEQLYRQLPRWYRDHPTSWAGVTVTATSGRNGVTTALVALRVRAMEDMARRLPPNNTYLIAEIDRVLIHEIYGHLAPVIATHAQQECPDHLRSGEVTPCVKLREQQIAAELNNYRLAYRGQ